MLGNMTLRNRLILLVVVTLAGMTILAGMSALRGYRDYLDALQVSHVSSVIPRLERITAVLRAERGLSVAVALDRAGRFQERLDAAREDTAAALDALRKSLAERGLAQNHPELWRDAQRLLDQVRGLITERERALDPQGTAQTITRYAAVIDQAQELLRGILVRTASRDVRELQAGVLQLDRLLEGAGFERAAALNMMLSGSHVSFELRRYQQGLGNQPLALDGFAALALPPAQIDAIRKAEEAGQYPALVEGRAALAYETEKIRLLPQLHRALGMGGLIHNFKNYVLRGTPNYAARVRTLHQAASGTIEMLAATPGISSADRAALEKVQQVIDQYIAALARAERQRAADTDIAAIDAAVRIDDTPLEQGLADLGKFATDVSPVRWWDDASSRYQALARNLQRMTRDIELRLLLDAEEEFRGFLVVTGIAVMLGLAVVLLALFTYRRLIGGIDAIVGLMVSVAETGDLEARVQVETDDEIGQMGRAFEKILAADRNLRDQALKLSRGEAVPDLQARGGSDQLAAAMNALNRSSRELSQAADRIASGDYEVDIRPRSEEDVLGIAMREMAASLLRFQADSARESWIREGQIGLVNASTGEKNVEELAAAIMDFLPRYIGARAAVMYALQPGRGYVRAGGYACDQRDAIPEVIQEGAGLVGQAVRDRTLRVVSDLPADYFPVGSALGASEARHVVLVPLVAETAVPGVLEFAWFGEVGEAALEVLRRVQEAMALALVAAQARVELAAALEESRRQADELQASEEELQAQAEELRASNEELEAKTAELEEQSSRLRASEEELQAQSEELRAANEELEQRAVALEEKTRLLDQAMREVEKRAAEVEQASRYKSEFLANMSHELRTPLNSMLILSKDLQENADGNLSPEDVECAGIIHESGSNLLRLINDILDLSKVEAGKIELHIDDVRPAMLGESLQKRYAPVAREKNLGFDVEIADDVPGVIRTDPMRFEQIITNLISNGLKFTHEGGLSLRFYRTERDGAQEPMLTVAVRDTGIGISEENREKVFRAFEQADGSTSRQYGGTGLGLAISKEMAHLLGGDLVVESVEGQGSTFFLTVPVRIEAASSRPGPPADSPTLAALRGSVVDASSEQPAGPEPADAGGGTSATGPAEEAAPVDDDRGVINPGEPCIVIVEDDVTFAKILLEEVRERGLRGLVATDGPQGVELVRRHHPIGVLLDINLPGADGWWVMSQLKKAEDLRRIPVHFLSANDESRKARSLGALGYNRKPVSRADIRSAIGSIQSLHDNPHRRLLVIDDDPDEQELVREELESDFVEVVTSGDVEDALQKLQDQSFHCVVLDLRLPGGGGRRFLELAEQKLDGKLPPVVVHTCSDMTPELEELLERHAAHIVSKTSAMGHLEDEVALFLHSVRRGAGEATVVAPAEESDLADRAVLVVDDDMRNTFSLSRILRRHGMRVFMAQAGERALSQLREHADEIDLVLMDIMMPGMDGYRTIAEIRSDQRFRKLPIIALTAKAMAGDREKCLRAGANDYLAKPLDTDKLFNMLRTWLA